MTTAARLASASAVIDCDKMPTPRPRRASSATVSGELASMTMSVARHALVACPLEHGSNPTALRHTGQRLGDVSARGIESAPTERWPGGTTATSRSLTIGRESRSAGGVDAQPINARSRLRSRSRSTIRSEVSSVRVMSTSDAPDGTPPALRTGGATVRQPPCQPARVPDRGRRRYDSASFRRRRQPFR